MILTRNISGTLEHGGMRSLTESQKVKTKIEEITEEKTKIVRNFISNLFTSTFSNIDSEKLNEHVIEKLNNSFIDFEKSYIKIGFGGSYSLQEEIVETRIEEKVNMTILNIKEMIKEEIENESSLTLESVFKEKMRNKILEKNDLIGEDEIFKESLKVMILEKLFLESGLVFKSNANSENFKELFEDLLFIL